MQAALNWLAGSPGITFLFIFILSFAIRLEALMNIPSRYLIPNPDWELVLHRHFLNGDRATLPILT